MCRQRLDFRPVPLPVRREGTGVRRHPASRCRRRLQAQVLPLQLGTLRTGDGGGDLAHAARTCAVGTGVRLSAHAEHDFRSASAILRDRRYGSQSRGGNSRERRSRELIWCLINALTCSSARRTQGTCRKDARRFAPKSHGCDNAGSAMNTASRPWSRREAAYRGRAHQNRSICFDTLPPTTDNENMLYYRPLPSH